MDVKTVVIVTDYAHVNGGNAKVALSSALALANSGTQTIVFAATGPIADSLKGKSNLDVVCLGEPEFLADPNVLRGAKRGLWSFSAAERMKQVLSAHDSRTTIVHVHSWTKALSASVIDAAHTLGFSLVLTLHDYFTFCPNGSYYDHALEAPCRVEPMSLSCVRANCDSRSRAQKGYRLARQAIAEWIAGVPSRVRHFISVSPFSRDIAAPFLGGDAVIYDVDNPVDVLDPAQAEVPKNSDFVYVGRLSREKGIDIFAEACAQADARGVVVGDGPLGESLRASTPHLEFTGWLDTAGVRARLRSARALVLPARWYETHGLVVYEAAALGVPSIVSDVCAPARAIIDGVTGLLFRSGDAADLAAKMRTLQKPRLAEHLGRMAHRDYWSRPLTMERHLASLYRAYDDILARRSVPKPRLHTTSR